MPIYDLYSKRGKPLPDVFVYEEIPQKLKNQLAMLIDYGILRGAISGVGHDAFIADSARNVICQEHGIFGLTDHKCGHIRNEVVDAITGEIDGKEGLLRWLDIIEVFLKAIYKSQVDRGLEHPARDEIETANHRFRENGVGYEFDYESLHLIKVDNIVTHREAVKPALHLLSGNKYEKANEEFLEALQDFKQGDYDDCLVKCGSAFESVMKIICKDKGWPYNEKDTASPLLKTIITRAGMEPFFEQPLILIATIRNKLSTAHGQGGVTKNPPEHYAAYAINATASAILLLTAQV